MTKNLVVDLVDQDTLEVLVAPIIRICRSLRIMVKSLQEMDSDGIYWNSNLGFALSMDGILNMGKQG